jgi:hypothetical protein
MFFKRKPPVSRLTAGSNDTSTCMQAVQPSKGQPAVQILVKPVPLSGTYRFMYENFIVATQHELFLLLEKTGEILKGLKFESSVFKYGYPNDEVGHPHLSGPHFYQLCEIENSPWIQELRHQNSQHPRDTPALHNGKKHYIIRFKDVTLDVVARNFSEFEMTEKKFNAVVAKELENISSDF